MKIVQFALILPISVLSACTHTPVEKVDVNQLGDNQLNCDQIRAEIDHMNSVIAAANDEAQSAATAAAAGSIAETAAGVLGAFMSAPGRPYMGGLSGSSTPGLATTAQAASQTDATQARTAATQRKDHLVQEFNRKNCTIPYR
jgi:hypothetical protein